VRRATHRLPGLVLTDHEFGVPLDHARPDGDRITVFAREMVASSRERDDLPWLVFFQGGPGGEAPRPTSARETWLPRALKEYRVLLLDQRGTGRSTPLNRQTLATLGDPQTQATYLRHFRADAIVRDAEWIRRDLLGNGGRWSVLGQSFGGFCVTTYLSFAPEGLREAVITGGLPPLVASAEEVYRATYPRVLERNRRYYERYPDDAKVTAEVVAALRAEPVRLPGGDPLTPRRLQLLGHSFGMRDGFERLHYLLEDAFVEGQGGRVLSDRFLLGVEAATSTMFATNPLYAIVHEACYCQGAASRWAAERVRAEFPELDLDSGGPVYFTGEMIYPWMFEEDAALRPLREAAELLAAFDAWPPLYDPAQLAANEVPCAAAVYYDDMYVDAGLSLETAGAVRGLRTWVTNEHEHDGLRRDGEELLDHLIALARGER
jgi:pimeloyl-ACP methyl ester carboxylesterase